jgi:hypothetical protein
MAILRLVQDNVHQGLIVILCGMFMVEIGMVIVLNVVGLKAK